MSTQVPGTYERAFGHAAQLLSALLLGPKLVISAWHLNWREGLTDAIEL
jgi:hypothetical protein